MLQPLQRRTLSPREVGQQKIDELKQELLEDDCYLPWNRREIPKLSIEAKLTASEGDPEPLRNGIDRPVGAEDNGWTGELGSYVQYTFQSRKR